MDLLYVGEPNKYSGLQADLSIAQRRVMGGGRQQNSGNASQKGENHSIGRRKEKKGFGKAPKIKFISTIIIIPDGLTDINK